VSISGSIERRLSVCSSAPAPLMAVRKSCARNRAAIAKAESPGEGPSELLRRPPITHQPKQASRSPRQPPIPPGRPLCVSDREARADCQGGELIDRIAARARPGSSWPQSTRIAQLKRRPTSNVDSMMGVAREARRDRKSVGMYYSRHFNGCRGW
jgi:hypothetical protein